MKSLDRKAKKLIGLSMIVATYAIGVNAEASSIGPITGILSFVGSIGFKNKDGNTITTLPYQPPGTTDAGKLPVTTDLHTNGVGFANWYEFTDTPSLLGTFTENGFNSQPLAVNFANFNFIDTTGLQNGGTGSSADKTANILNQVPSGNLPAAPFVEVKNGSYTFDFALTSVDAAGSFSTYGYTFILAGQGILSGNDGVGGTYNTENATFNLIISAPPGNVSDTPGSTYGQFVMSGSITPTVPVPSAVFFVGPALAGLFGWSRRKKAANFQG